MSQDQEITKYIELWIAKYRLEKAKIALAHALSEPKPEPQNPVALVATTSTQEILIMGGDLTPVAPSWNLAFFRWIQKTNALEHHGSGTLIDVPDSKRQYAIVTGHQWDFGDERIKNYRAGWGLLCMKEFDDREYVFRVKLVKNFRETSNTRSPDLAVVELENFNHRDKGIPLLDKPEFKRLFNRGEDQCGVVFGWGMAKQEVLSAVQCLRHAVMEFKELLSADENLFSCWSFDERGPADADSGGPLVVTRNGKCYLAGIVKGIKLEGEILYHTNANPCRFVSIPLLADRIIEEVKDYEKRGQ